MKSKNDLLIDQVMAAGAPAFLIDFMQRYPYVIPDTDCHITTAYRQYVPLEVWEQKRALLFNG